MFIKYRITNNVIFVNHLKIKIMKGKLVVFVIAMFAMIFFACSTEKNEDVELSTLSPQRLNALSKFGKAFNSNFDYFVSTRGVSVNVSEEDYDSVASKIGADICNKVLIPSSSLVAEFGITDDDFEEAIKEITVDLNLSEIPTLEEAKCMTALCIYDVYLHDNTTYFQTRASAADYILCAATGWGVKDMVNAGGAVLAKKVLTKAAARLVPGFGWCYGIMSAAYCIFKL